MKNKIISNLFLLIVFSVSAQQNLTPEMLLQLGRISAIGITKDGVWLDPKDSKTLLHGEQVKMKGTKIPKLDISKVLIQTCLS